MPTMGHADEGANAPVEIPGDPEAGKKVFDRKCSMCHALGKPSTLGPSLFGVVGRKPGSVARFTAYSPALRKAQGKWTPARLDSFLIAPAKLVPGTRMAVSIPDPTERSDVVAFLQAQK